MFEFFGIIPYFVPLHPYVLENYLINIKFRLNGEFRRFG